MSFIKRAVKWTAILAIVIVAVSVIAVAAGGGTEAATKAATEHITKTDPGTKAKMRDVRLGMSKAEVRAILGAPDDTTTSSVKVMGDTTRMDVWTYGMFGWVLSFTDGHLDGKTRL